MRYNSHLTQSQDQVGDLGKGITDLKSTSAGIWPISPAVDSGIAAPALSAVVNSSNKSMTGDVTYRHAFIDRVFSRKQNGGKTYFQRFFDDDGVFDEDTKNVTTHPTKRPLAYELPTSGQVYDFMFRKNFGVIDYHLGDMKPSDGDRTKSLYFLFSDTAPVRYVGAGAFPVPDEATWSAMNFRDKITDIFKKLFNDDLVDTYGFKLHAKGFYGGSIQVSTNLAVESKMVNLYAGKTEIPGGDDEIFRVLGGPTDYKSIMLRDQNNIKPSSGGKRYPTGIASEYVSGSGETWLDYTPIAGQSFGFIDVSRYYLRYANRHGIGTAPSAKMTYLAMEGTGMPLFTQTQAGGTVQVPFMSGNVSAAPSSRNVLYFTLSRCVGKDQAVDTNKKFFDFFFNLSSANDDGGIGFIHNDGLGGDDIRNYRIYVEKVTKDLMISNLVLGAASKTKFPFYAAPNGTQQFLTSNSPYNEVVDTDEGETIWGKVVTFGYKNRYFRKWVCGSQKTVSLGATVGTLDGSLYESRFLVKQYDNQAGGGNRKMIGPRLGADSEFIVTSPMFRQEILNGLKISGASLYLSNGLELPSGSDITASGVSNLAYIKMPKSSIPMSVSYTQLFQNEPFGTDQVAVHPSHCQVDFNAIYSYIFSVRIIGNALDGLNNGAWGCLDQYSTFILMRSISLGLYLSNSSYMAEIEYSVHIKNIIGADPLSVHGFTQFQCGSATDVDIYVGPMGHNGEIIKLWYDVSLNGINAYGHSSEEAFSTKLSYNTILLKIRFFQISKA